MFCVEREATLCRDVTSAVTSRDPVGVRSTSILGFEVPTYFVVTKQTKSFVFSWYFRTELWGKPVSPIAVEEKKSLEMGTYSSLRLERHACAKLEGVGV